jgi:hypothetical protein
MTHRWSRTSGALTVIALAAIPLAGAARAQSDTSNASQNQAPSPPALANAYRGMFVCEQQPGAADILHVPLDVAVRGTDVQFARPLFNLRGTRVLGSELGDGSVGADGKVHVTSAWEFHGITVRGDYSGTLTPSGGTLTGTQSWHAPGGEARSRTCQAAMVPAPNARHAAAN